MVMYVVEENGKGELRADFHFTDYIDLLAAFKYGRENMETKKNIKKAIKLTNKISQV